MSTDHSQERAVALLQELGLKEYEARCFVALTRLPVAKAREIGEAADVPRTRVYEAVENLADLGLVETQQASPKQFRAVSVEEALDVLRERYEQRFAELGSSLDDLEPVRESESNPGSPGVWTLSGIGTIRARARKLIGECEEEVVYLVGDESALSEDVLAQLADASGRELPVYVGTSSDAIYERIADAVPDAQRLDSWIEQLWAPGESRESWRLGQLLVVDRHGVLISVHRETPQGRPEDSAIWTTGVGNGLGMVADRLLSAGIERLGRAGDGDENEGDASEDSSE